MVLRRRWLLFTIAVLAASVVAYCWHVVSISLEAENTLHAYTAVLESMAVYVRENDGRWPQSWDDLAKMNKQEYGIFEWPRDIPEIRKRVDVRFDLTASDVAEMDSNRFTAVEQMGPNYGTDLARIERLKEAARLAVKQEAKTRPSP